MVITDVHSPEKERPTLVPSSAVSETEKLEEDDVHDVLQDDKEALAINSTDNFPEGGFHAWAATVGGYINSFGVYQDFYVRRYLQNVTPSNIGWIGGAQIFLTFSLGAITGRIFDRGYCCTLIYAISLFTLSLSHENSYYQVFLTNGIGLGIASGLTYTLSFALIGHYYSKRRSLAVGIVSSGSAIGAIFHPILVNHLINGRIGFHNGVRISASINVTLLIIATCIMKTRLSPKKNQTFPILQWSREPPYCAILFGCVFCFMGLFFPVFYLQLNAIKHGVPRQFAFYILSILNAASFFGRTIPAFIAPTFGVFNLGAFFTTATGLVILCMAFMKDLTGTVLFAVFYGLCSGASVALTPSMLASTAKDMNEVGTRMGIYFGIGGILGLFATPISGALLTSQYHWIRAIVFSGVAMTLGGLFFGLSRSYVARQKGTHRV
ncbi:hypothetical protein CVT25_003141 [Psilocybe cyanescens]|uniref:Major facilitator superfamily (MFS) profile domain-containing protein n=1 Tax=Psilocybe cyanescens TaxID=93625 RepID=A0A409XK86_PSICY|nr:hypothetical protein CVT25_003141 [Psilocybe cyanescens]